MSSISQTTPILSFSSYSSPSAVVTVAIGVVFALSLSPMVLAEQESSHILRLPSETAGERQIVCGAKCVRTSSVCGVDGETYWCGCAEAEWEVTKVAKLGFCEVGSRGLTPLLLVHIVGHIVIGVSVFFDLF